jgi:hypothetical protein
MGAREWGQGNGGKGMGAREWGQGNGAREWGKGMGTREWGQGNGDKGMGTREWGPPGLRGRSPARDTVRFARKGAARHCAALERAWRRPALSPLTLAPPEARGEYPFPFNRRHGLSGPIPLPQFPCPNSLSQFLVPIPCPNLAAGVCARDKRGLYIDRLVVFRNSLC